MELRAFLPAICSVSFLLGQSAPAPDLGTLLEQVRAKTGAPGIAAAVVKDGKILAVAVRGVREQGKPAQVQPGDRFLVGSCTKPMTRLLLARLAQAGKLRFEATLADAFAGVPMREEYRGATVADLLRHTAGVPAYTRITPKETPIVFELQGEPHQRRERFAAHVLQQPPAAPPGRFLYSNAGFVLLGSLAERIGGEPWESLMAKEVFTPLGMASAAIGRGEEKGPVPSGHRRASEGFEPARSGPPVAGLLAPAGGVVLAVEDFARFAIAQIDAERGRGGSFLSEPTLKSMPSLRPADAAPGEGEVFLGGEGTFTAAFATWPSFGFGVVVCTNAGDSDDACVAAVDALRAAFAPKIPVPKREGGRGRGLGVQLRAEEGGDLQVVAVAPGSPAARSGLQAGDRILAIGGKPVKDLGEGGIRSALQAPGAKLTLRRGAQTVECVLPKD